MLGAVQMPEGYVMGAREHCVMYRLDPADLGKRPLALRCCATVDKGMGNDHPSVALPHVRPCAGDLSLDDIGRTGDGVDSKSAPGSEHLTEWESRDGHTAIDILEDQRLWAICNWTADQNTPGVLQSSCKADALRSIVIPGNSDDGTLCVLVNTLEEVTEKLNRLLAGHRSVEHIASDNQGIHVKLLQSRKHLVQ
jgi:hypothetical protein